MNEQAQIKLEQMKKTGKLLSVLSRAASILVVVMLVMYLLMPAANMYLEGSSSKYGRAGGYNYYGWQLTIIGYGYPPVAALAMLENAATLAGDFIPTSFDFYPNPSLMGTVIIPIVTMIVLGIVASRMRNRGKAVCEWITAAVLIYSGVMIANCVNLAIPMATNAGTTTFRNSYLIPAVNAGTFTTCAFPIIVCAVLVIFALLKAFRGGFLIVQRNTALKLKK